ncbi:DNA methylase N-4/N-6 domain-containing protein [Haloterrigena salina JCM 13891]|uniref:DNA methylase N-4/N-6 domain-containing protein n=1 Tax=Haloterrigena salina JCM 13891 TaxID=1227488 RepID=M0CMG2_9EURY|nr:DNA methylase N-4/N-6 domain-containing protein [Haloterrigena salina JCM 13891]
MKPINLMRYLVRLVTPPEGTVLDPFAGSGTTGCACEVESFDYVLIEKRERFVNEIISQRLEYWSDPENWGDLKDHNALPDPSTAESEESSADAMDESTLDQFVEGES